MGQKATSAGDRTKSALPPRTDIAGREREVRFTRANVPAPDHKRRRSANRPEA